MLKPTVTTSKKMIPSFMEREITALLVTKTKGGMNGNFVERDSDTTYYKPQPTPESVVKLPSGTRSAIQRVLSHLVVVRRSNVEAIVKNRLTKWTNTPKLQIVRADEFTCDDKLQASYSNLRSNGLNSAMFTIDSQGLGGVVLFGRAPTVFWG